MSSTAIAEQLATVYDPEVGIDIVSMGLVYGIEDGPEGVRVVMTTTFEGCPMGGAILDAVCRTLQRIRPEGFVDVELTYEPHWCVEMLSDGARRQLRR